MYQRERERDGKKTRGERKRKNRKRSASSRRFRPIFSISFAHVNRRILSKRETLADVPRAFHGASRGTLEIYLLSICTVPRPTVHARSGDAGVAGVATPTVRNVEYAV